MKFLLLLLISSLLATTSLFATESSSKVTKTRIFERDNISKYIEIENDVYNFFKFKSCKLILDPSDELKPKKVCQPLGRVSGYTTEELEDAKNRELFEFAGCIVGDVVIVVGAAWAGVGIGAGIGLGGPSSGITGGVNAVLGAIAGGVVGLTGGGSAVVLLDVINPYEQYQQMEALNIVLEADDIAIEIDADIDDFKKRLVSGLEKID